MPLRAYAIMAPGGPDLRAYRGEHMSTVADAVCRLWWRRFFIVLAILAVIAVIAVLTSARFGAARVALTPPRLPEPIDVKDQVRIGGQTWADEQANQFHHEAQGTHTLPIPLSWFLALESPLNHPIALPFAKRGRFADDSYLLRFGFISSPKDPNNNKYGLPIGFSYSPFQSIRGLSHQDTSVGFTCAACHTGQLIYRTTLYRRRRPGRRPISAN